MTTNVYPAEPWDSKFKKQSAGDNLEKKKKTNKQTNKQAAYKMT